jgi:hypothetical protein
MLCLIYIFPINLVKISDLLTVVDFVLQESPSISFQLNVSLLFSELEKFILSSRIFDTKINKHYTSTKLVLYIQSEKRICKGLHSTNSLFWKFLSF